MQKLLFTLLVVLIGLPLAGQSTFINYSRDYYHLIDRFDILYSNKANNLKTTYKPIRKVELNNYLLNIDSANVRFSRQDQFNFEYLLNDNWQFGTNTYNDNDKSWWNVFYNRKSDFLYFDEDNFSMRINPVLDLSVGLDQRSDDLLYTNTRGLEVSGSIDDKIGFYTFLSTTQVRVPQYVADFVRSNRAFPYEGFYKIDDRDKSLFDIFHARGYFTFNLTKSIDIQAGHDKQFIGNGIRSMVMSDFSSPMLFGKINTRVGPFTYTNLWAELTEDIIFSSGGSPFDGRYPKKFMATHRLGVDITPNFNIGVYESIITDSVNINYFNPIIFYRAIEQQQGSPDNILVGMDFQWNIKNRAQLYGQFILDEFYLSALTANDGDWRNKFGVQIGLKYLNLFEVDNLDIQVEANFARPYFYAYDRPELSYTNYRNPLAHPMGANLDEILFEVRYQPSRKLNLIGKLFLTNYGEDENGLNYGGNPLESTNDRIGNTGNFIGQGVNTQNAYVEFTGSYMILNNMFIDWRNIYRSKESELESRTNSGLISTISLRWNFVRREHEF
jgi:hypothetical protein